MVLIDDKPYFTPEMRKAIATPPERRTEQQKVRVCVALMLIEKHEHGAVWRQTKPRSADGRYRNEGDEE